MPYAVIKVETQTGKCVDVFGRDLLFMIADQVVERYGPNTQDGYYLSAVNENDERLTEYDKPANQE